MNATFSNEPNQSILEVKALIINGKTPLYAEVEQTHSKTKTQKLVGESLRKDFWTKSAYNAVKGWESGTIPSEDTLVSLCEAYNSFVKKNLPDQYSVCGPLKPKHLSTKVPKYTLARFLGHKGRKDKNKGWIWDFNNTFKTYEWEIVQRNINEVLMNAIDETKPYLNTHSECNVALATLGTVNRMYSFSYKKRPKKGSVLLKSTMHISQPVVHSAAKELYQIPFQACVCPPFGASRHIATYNGKINVESNNIEMSMSNPEYNDKAHMLFDPTDHEFYLGGVFVGRLFSGALHGDVIVIDPDPVPIDMDTPEKLREFMFNEPESYDDFTAIPESQISKDLLEYILYKRNRARKMLK